MEYISLGEVDLYRDMTGGDISIKCRGHLYNKGGSGDEKDNVVVCVDVSKGQKFQCEGCPGKKTTLLKGLISVISVVTMAERFENDFRMGEIPV
jgi:hypothetical protein